MTFLVAEEFCTLIVVVMVTQIYRRAKIAQNYTHAQTSARETGGSKVYGLCQCQCQCLGCDPVPQ